MSPSARRSGWLLVEMVLALTMAAVVIGSLATLISGGVRWTRSLSDQTEALEVARTVWVVVEDEVRTARAGRDWRVDETGALALRAFRGIARICAVESVPEEWTVAFRGRRSPDPLRDSILVLEDDGVWRSFALESSVSSEGCQPLRGESVLRWVSNHRTGRSPVLARTFERGSYHLADGAFRYRRGAGGRQPLTTERLLGTSGFRRVGNALEVTLVLTDPEGGGASRSFLWLTRAAGSR